MVAIFGPEGKEVVDTSDPSTSRRNREVFAVAMAEGWRLTDQGANEKTLIVGNEAWPFPIPLVKGANGWRFDTAAGKEEVIARRIGRNELAVILICHTYVTAQHLYAQPGHDGQPAGIYAKTFRVMRVARTDSIGPRRAGRSEARWETSWRRPPRKVAARRIAGTAGAVPRLLLQDPDRAGFGRAGRDEGLHQGQQDDRRFALVAWPAQNDVTGVMTFVVNGKASCTRKISGRARTTK